LPGGSEAAVGTYRAAVVHAFHEPLTVEHVNPVALEPGPVRVKVAASGLCHTWGTRSTAVSPSTPWPTAAAWSRCLFQQRASGEHHAR